MMRNRNRKRQQQHASINSTEEYKGSAEEAAALRKEAVTLYENRYSGYVPSNDLSELLRLSEVYFVLICFQGMCVPISRRGSIYDWLSVLATCAVIALALLVQILLLRPADHESWLLAWVRGKISGEQKRPAFEDVEKTSEVKWNFMHNVTSVTLGVILLTLQIREFQVIRSDGSITNVAPYMADCICCVCFAVTMHVSTLRMLICTSICMLTFVLYSPFKFASNNRQVVHLSITRLIVSIISVIISSLHQAQVRHAFLNSWQLRNFIEIARATEGELRSEIELERQKPFWRIERSEVTLSKVIGRGSFGMVRQGAWHGTAVAAKEIVRIAGRHDPTANELDVLARIRHPNICLFMGAIVDDEGVVLVSELARRGSLWNILRDLEGRALRGFEKLPFDMRVELARDITRGLGHIHSVGLVHGDIKSANVLVTKNWRAKIGDFGFASWLRTDKPVCSTGYIQPIIGTAQWLAPELLSDENPSLSQSSDIYAVAVILWELATGLKPFSGMETEAVLLCALKGGRPTTAGPGWGERQAEIPDAWKSLTEVCWHVNPQNRPKCLETILPKLMCMIGENVDWDSTAELSPVDVAELEQNTSVGMEFLQLEGLPKKSVSLLESSEDFLSPEHDAFAGTMGSIVCTVRTTKTSGQEVAVIRRPYRTAADVLSYEKEINTLKLIQPHPNTMEVYCTQYSESLCAIDFVLEYLPNATLREKLSNLSASHQLLISLDIAAWLHFVHCSGLIWRGCQPAYIFLTNINVAKMFGFKWMKELSSNSNVATRCGSPAFVAPEVIRGDPYGTPADIYSVGILFWELWNKSLPYREVACSVAELLSYIESGRRPTDFVGIEERDREDSFVKQQMNHLMCSMWASESASRPSSRVVLTRILHILSETIRLGKIKLNSAEEARKRIELLTEQAEIACGAGDGEMMQIWIEVKEAFAESVQTLSI